jgi:hypothetical protein
MNASAARNAIAQTGAQLSASNSTTGDITISPTSGTGPYASLMSQVVVTLTIPYTGGTGTTLPVITAGTVYHCGSLHTDSTLTLVTTTTYPYGNFD